MVVVSTIEVHFSAILKVVQCRVILKRNQHLYLLLLLDVDPCRPNPCLNSGACLHTDEGFVCNCSRGYKGEHCQGLCS